MNEAKPVRLGPYSVADEIGRGAGGVVYRAVGPAGEDVAVKTLSHASEWTLASLRAEIHALGQVEHSGVVRVLADGLDGSRPWFAMNRVEGETLGTFARQLATRQPGAPRRAWTPEALQPVLSLAVRICDALAAIHEAGIVHRDLKPDNIVLREGNDPVIVDFGLAVPNPPRESRAAPRTPAVAGTRAYMAPEQLTGEVIDARTDLYALGAILFELLTGRAPAHAGGGTSASRLADGVPEPLDALVASLLHPIPRYRIGHAQDIATCLRTVLGETGRVEQPSSHLRGWLYRPLLAGRHEALERIDGALERLREGSGSFAVLLGESGIGKTHIAAEGARRAAEGATVVSVVCETPDRAGAPLACWTKLLELVADHIVSRPDSAAATVARRHGPLLANIHHSLSPATTAHGRGAQPVSTPDEVFVVLRDLLTALSEDRPILLLLDDIQWADEVTMHALKLLVRSPLLDRPVFFLATCRDDESSPGLQALLDSTTCDRIQVGPLPESDVRELVADMLGVSEPPEAVVEWVAARAEGNPFLAAEYLRMVVSEVPMQRVVSPPVVRVESPPSSLLDGLSVPRSVHEVAARRLSLLAPAARAVLDLVALIGGTIDSSVLSAVTGDEAGRHAFTELERRQLMERTAGGGAKLLHDRLRVAAVARIEDDNKVRLHRRAAELLSAASEPTHGSIAHHYVQAGMPSEALPHMERAGQRALALAAYDTAARHFDDARATANVLASQGTQFPTLRRVRWEHGSARAHFGKGELVASETRVRAALDIAGWPLPTSRGGWLRLTLRQAANRALPSAEGVAFEPDVTAELAVAASLLPHRYFYDEDMLPVLGSSLLAGNLARRAGVPALAGPASTLAAMAGMFRFHGAAQRHFDEASQSALNGAEWRDAAQALALESFHHAGFGRFREAERAAERAVAACSNMADPWMTENAETTLCHVEFFTGRFAEARRRARRIAQAAAERQHVQHHVWGLYLQARSDLPTGDYESARALLDTALSTLGERSELISKIACKGMLAEAASALELHELAEASALEVVRLVGERVPTAYPALVGYAGAARALRSLCERSATPTRWSAARRLALGLWRFASLFPMAEPAAHLHAGHLLRLGGYRRAANLVFRRGSIKAQAFGMPYERALLQFGDARTNASTAKSQRIESESLAALSALGAVPGD